MAANKEAIAIVLDVGPSMNQVPPGEATALQTSLDTINMILQLKMFAKSKDEVALILCGTPNTAIELGGRFIRENISVPKPLGLVSRELLQYVQNDVQPSTVSGNFLDALFVAMDHVMDGIQDKQGFGSKRIILFSDVGGKFGDGYLEHDIIGLLKESDIELIVIGPDLNDAGNGARPSTSNGHVKPKTAQQKAGQKLLKHILDGVEGGFYSFNEVPKALSDFQISPIRDRYGQMARTWLRKNGCWILTILAVLLGILFHILFYGNTPGVHFQPEDADITGRYNMDTKPKGNVMIFNNKEFDTYLRTGRTPLTRHGTDEDVKKLNDTFRRIGFEVEVKNDLTAVQMKTEAKNFAVRKDHDSTSASVLVILSHGNEGHICAKDDIVKLDDILNEFTADNSPVLAGKPKLFLIQACRGGGRDVAADDIDTDDVELAEDHITKLGQCIPKFADMIVGYATNPGLVSVRYPSGLYPGSVYIQTFGNVLGELWESEDINGIFTEVHSRVAEADHYPTDVKGDKYKIKQMPETGRNTLRKKWYLK